MAGVIISAVMMAAAGIALTHPLELRAWRWAKIGISLPFAMVVGLAFESIYFGFPALFAILFLAHAWKFNFAHFLAGPVVNTMYAASESAIPDFRAARGRRADGDLKEALRLAEHELNKNGRDVEGLLFVATLLTESNQLERALHCLHRVIEEPEATEAQVSRAWARQEQLSEIMTLRKRHALACCQ